jgi:shikimate dehydrogenase
VTISRAGHDARFAVVGKPIAHSRSPTIHRAFAAQFGLHLTYDRIEVEPGRLASALAGFRAAGGYGVNVTLPLKEEAFALATRRAERAERAGAANTLSLLPDGVAADNTDGAGLLRDLEHNHGMVIAGRRVLLVGAGGAAKSVVPALLAARPACLAVTNRSPARVQGLLSRVDPPAVQVLTWGAPTAIPFDLIVNATSASLAGEVPSLHSSNLGSATVCYDMMYGPNALLFAAAMRELGAARVIDGLGMLVEQAAESFFIWHGLRPATISVINDLRASLPV